MNSNIRRFATALTLTLALAAAGTTTAAPRETRDRGTREPRLVLIIKKLFGISITSDLPSIPIPSTSSH